MVTTPLITELRNRSIYFKRFGRSVVVEERREVYVVRKSTTSDMCPVMISDIREIKWISCGCVKNSESCVYSKSGSSEGSVGSLGLTGFTHYKEVKPCESDFYTEMVNLFYLQTLPIS